MGGLLELGLDSFLDTPADRTFTHHVIGTGDDHDADTQRTWMICGAQDSLGWRWLGTDTANSDVVGPIGIEVYDPGLVPRRIYDQSNSEMSGILVRGLTVTSNRRLWVGYDPGGLDFVTGPPDSAHFNHLPITDGSLRASRACALCAASLCYGESLWVVTNNEVWRFNDAATVLSRPAQNPLLLRGGMSTLAVKPLATGLDGAVWVATAGGLRVFRPGARSIPSPPSILPIPNDDVRAVAVDPSSGVVWATTAGGPGALRSRST